MSRSDRKYSTFLVHIVFDKSMVRVAIRIHARYYACRRMGRMLFIYCA